MTNDINSAIAAMLRQFARAMRYPSVRAAVLLVFMTVASGGTASAAGNETEAGPSLQNSWLRRIRITRTM
jgi:hypothetical protein